MSQASLSHTLAASVSLAVFILLTIVGNSFVIAAIVLERNLRSVANYLIASLAVADLLVAALVMPLAAVNEVLPQYVYDRSLCDAWISLDVLCCTSSILHLVAISLDRYWAVTRVDYVRQRSARRIFMMIALSWAISTVISTAPLAGWGRDAPRPAGMTKDGRGSEDVVFEGEIDGRGEFFVEANSSDELMVMRDVVTTARAFQLMKLEGLLEVTPSSDFQSYTLATTAVNPPETITLNYSVEDPLSASDSKAPPLNSSRQHSTVDESDTTSFQGDAPGPSRCLISQDWGYTIFSTVGAFYIPLVFMMIIYAQIYRTARERIRRQRFTKTWSASSTATCLTAPPPSRSTSHVSTLPQASHHRAKAYSFGGPASLSLACHARPRGSIDASRLSSITDEALERVRRRASSVPAGVNRRGGIEGGVRGSLGSPRRVSAQGLGARAGQGEGAGTPARSLGQQSSCVSESVVSGDDGGGGTSSSDERLSGSADPLNSEVGRDESKMASKHCARHTAATLDHSTSAVVIKSLESRTREKREQRRERKAARTLAVITGSFTICWLPFFILALVRPFCGENCNPPKLAESLIGWLGYCNSLLNPIIYTVFSPDFRRAFRKILSGKYRRGTGAGFDRRAVGRKA